MPYSEMYEPMPRSRKTTMIDSGSHDVRAVSGFWKPRTIGITSHASNRSPAATTTMPNSASANVQR